jgi:hypothetical protein
MVRSSGLRQRPRNFDLRFSIILKKIIVVALTAKELNIDELKSGGLHEKHAVATWNVEPSQYLLKDRGKPRKPVSRWPVAGPSGCILTSSQQSGKQKYMGFV